MQVFIVGTPLETAMALDPLRLNKQLLETQQILDALNGKKAWSRHPAVLQYRGHEAWLESYMSCLIEIRNATRTNTSVLDCAKYFDKASELDRYCQRITPNFHTQEYFDQMKRRLYTKNPEHYKQWAHLGTSLENWYWSQEENKFIKYVNGKRIE